MIYHYHNTPIHYTLQGQGSPLVLLHGFLESSTMWQAFLPQLTKTHQVLTIDLPGHGKSGNLPETHTMEAMAKIVFKLANHLGIISFKLVGHSMGGYVGLAMVALQPKLINEFTLLNSTTYRDTEERKENRDRAIKFFTSQKQTIISMAIANLFTPEEHSSFKTQIEQLKAEAYSFNTEGLVSCVIGMRDRKDTTQMLKKFPQKTTFISGTHDPIAPIKDLREQAEITGKHLVEMNSGHMSWLTHPKNIMHFIE